MGSSSQIACLIAPCLMLAGCGGPPDRVVQAAGGDAHRGLELIREVGCGACHVIPGVDWPRGVVGPSLAGFGERTLIGGRFPNRPDTLAQWVREAPSLDPRTGMTPMPLSEEEARDVAAYLYTLHED